MEKLGHRASQWIDARKVWSLASVAAAARPCQVLHRIAAAMLLGHYMLEVKCRMRIGKLWQMAILTPPAGAVCNGFPRRRIHALLV
jgi:hypothetical protein